MAGLHDASDTRDDWQMDKSIAAGNSWERHDNSQAGTVAVVTTWTRSKKPILLLQAIHAKPYQCCCPLRSRMRQFPHEFAVWRFPTYWLMLRCVWSGLPGMKVCTPGLSAIICRCPCWLERRRAVGFNCWARAIWGEPGYEPLDPVEKSGQAPCGKATQRRQK